MNERKAHILVVEDNPDNYELVKKILAHYGYGYTIKMDGESAYVWCTENVSDLILMDISLPGMDGLEVIAKIKDLDTYANVPIVALTAHAMKGDEERFLAAGCSRYLAKPFLPVELVALLDDILES